MAAVTTSVVAVVAAVAAALAGTAVRAWQLHDRYNPWSRFPNNSDIKNFIVQNVMCFPGTQSLNLKKYF